MFYYPCLTLRADLLEQQVENVRENNDREPTEEEMVGLQEEADEVIPLRPAHIY